MHRYLIAFGLLFALSSGIGLLSEPKYDDSQKYVPAVKMPYGGGVRINPNGDRPSSGKELNASNKKGLTAWFIIGLSMTIIGLAIEGINQSNS